MSSITNANYLEKDSQIWHEKIIFFPDVLLPWRPTILAYASLSIINRIGFPLMPIKPELNLDIISKIIMIVSKELISQRV